MLSSWFIQDHIKKSLYVVNWRNWATFYLRKSRFNAKLPFVAAIRKKLDCHAFWNSLETLFAGGLKANFMLLVGFFYKFC
jgi:type II secretory pathway component PulF